MNSSVMAPAQQDQILELGRPAIGPVPDVMRVALTRGAPGEAAAPVAGGQRPADGRWDGSRPAPHVEHGSARVVPHDHFRRVARQAARRFRGNALAAGILEGGLARIAIPSQRLLLHMEDHV
jgi:hypothetical protein